MSTRNVAVANEKGGVGKTVTVINLGAALADMGKRVLVVDMDPQANATRGLGVTVAAGMPTTYDIIKNHKSPAADKAVVQTAWDGLDLLPADAELAGADIELVNEYGRENRLKRALAGICDRYDFIVMDTPPSLSLLTVNVFAFATEVLVPCQTHPYAYTALENLFDTIEVVQDEINAGLAVKGIVATFFDQRTRVSHEILEKLRTDERYRDLICASIIRINTTIAESANVGMPIMHFSRSSSGASDYRALAEELLGEGSRFQP